MAISSQKPTKIMKGNKQTILKCQNGCLPTTTLENQPFSTKQNCFKIQMKTLSLAALKLIS